jgi:Dolichyl-phosphate-mannose-protein mannosyltransferase
MQAAAELALFLIAVAIVNPFREMPYDDDWAFSETAKHFLETGQYRLNEWLAPNMPFQTVWGALFCLPFGFSFSALRISTIVLSVLGLVAFRALALEHGLSRGSANLFTFCLASSPLVFKLTLTYLSDVPFLALTIVSILFYTRALRGGRWLDWAAASAATSATIFVRQFGIAILGGLALVWLWDRQRFHRFPRYFVGAALPTLSTLWQLQQGWNQSNWAQTLLLHRQKTFFWGSGFLKQLPWRIPVLVEYVGWFLLPVALLAAFAVWRSLRSQTVGSDSSTAGSDLSVRSSESRTSLVVELAGWVILLLASVAYGAWMLNIPWLMPYLPWFFEILKLLGRRAELPATVLTIVGGVLFAHFLLRRYLVPANRPRLEQGILDAATFVSLLMALVFFVFGDKDVLIFLPLAAIAVGKQAEPVLVRHRRSIFVACLLVLVGTAVWTREDLCRNQAVWTLAARVDADDVPSEAIYAGWEWYGYHHFDDYVRAVPPVATTEFADFFGPWMDRQRAQAEYLIVHDPEPPPGEHYETVAQFTYFSVFSRGFETFYGVKRTDRPVTRIRRAPGRRVRLRRSTTR